MGAGQGIGKATALSFAASGATAMVLAGRTQRTLDETAAEVAAIAQSQSREIKTLVVLADITQESQVVHLHKTAKETFGRIDYVANAAGVFFSGFRHRRGC